MVTQGTLCRNETVNVLVVEDDTDAADSRARDLRRHGYQARCVATGEAALQVHDGCDLIVLSLELPDIDGLEVCRLIRDNGGPPVISVTARDTEADRVLALHSGADDCVAASCSPREMNARVAAVLRRARREADPGDALDFGALRIDLGSREATLNGAAVPLTAREFDLLHILARNPASVLSRRELMAQGWGSDWAHTSRTVDTHISSLRAKIGARWIITIHGLGYRLGRG
jgi:DNA-binding response OmpR family regulator